MIRGLHGMFYSSQADAMRAFLRDQLRLPFTDVGGGWLIFDLPEADIGVHPVDEPAQSGTQDISFYCDDIEGTVADLRARGIAFEGEIADQGWGHVTHFMMPGDVRVLLYEPKYQKSRKSSSRPEPTRRRAAPAKRAGARPARAAAAKRSPAVKARAKAQARPGARSKPTRKAGSKSRPTARRR